MQNKLKPSASFTLHCAGDPISPNISKLTVDIITTVCQYYKYSHTWTKSETKRDGI